MNIDLCRRALLSDDNSTKKHVSDEKIITDSHSNSDKKENPAAVAVEKAYKRHLMSSLCNVPLGSLNDNAEPKRMLSYGKETKPKVPFTSRVRLEDPYSHDILHALDRCQNGDMSTKRSSNNNVTKRKIPDKASRTLELEGVSDDYYLDLLSWSEDDVVAVGLENAVYLYRYMTKEIQHLTTLDGDDKVTSVSWCTMPTLSKHIAIGTSSNNVQLWDTHAVKRVRTIHGHSGRVSSLAWNQHWLTTGGSDSLILQHDVRCEQSWISTYKTHEQEVVGLKWNEDGSTLASGGNDNYLCLWDAKMSSSRRQHWVTPRLVSREHQAAVKALDWCPFHRGLLASGGGTTDRTIKLWNSNSGTLLSSTDTGSQVSSVIWSRDNRELCSSHGYPSNELILWKYGQRSDLTKMKAISGHTARVLSMVCSPDGSKVVSAGADETLRFWDMFGAPTKNHRSSFLSPTWGNMTFGMKPIR
jgi:cell division cycle protein 20 (cofactor of APC complex)